MKNDTKLNKAEVVAIIPTRIQSSRLPKKALLKLNGKPVLQHIIERMHQAKTIDDVVLATTEKKEDLEIVDFCKEINCLCVRGENDDVIQRMIDVSSLYEKDIIIVDTSHDCPLIDPFHIDAMAGMLKDNNYDYISNVTERTWPDGFDLQIYKRSALVETKKLITNPVHFVHAGWNILNYGQEKFNIGSFPATEEYTFPDWHLCLDTEEDYKLLQLIFEEFENKQYFSARAIIDFLKQKPELLNINKNVRRNHPDEG